MLVTELLTIIHNRRSVREFTRDPVSDEEIHLLLEAAHDAPSNSNRQPWKFLVVKNKIIIKSIADAVQKKIEEVSQSIQEPDLQKSFESYSRYFTFFQEAPIVIVALSKKSFSFLENVLKRNDLEHVGRTINPELMSVSMAIQNLQLTAHVIGLGTCCMTGPLLAANELKKILDIRQPFEITAIIPVGRYIQPLPAPARKNINSISETIE